jgi:hypothetical protein
MLRAVHVIRAVHVLKAVHVLRAVHVLKAVRDRDRTSPRSQLMSQRTSRFVARLPMLLDLQGAPNATHEVDLN